MPPFKGKGKPALRDPAEFSQEFHQALKMLKDNLKPDEFSVKIQIPCNSGLNLRNKYQYWTWFLRCIRAYPTSEWFKFVDKHHIFNKRRLPNLERGYCIEVTCEKLHDWDAIGEQLLLGKLKNPFNRGLRHDELI